MSPLKKKIFLSLSLLSIINSTAATDQLHEENFEVFRDRGLHDFFDEFGREISLELGFEDPIEKQKREEEYRQKIEQEAVEVLKKVEEEEAQRKARKEAKKQAEEKTKQTIERLETQLAEAKKRKEQLAWKATAEAQKKVEAEQQRVKEQREAELRERKMIFAIREAMIDERINQYKVLTAPSLNCGQLYEACMKLFPNYDMRVKFNKGLQIHDDGMPKILYSRLYTTSGRAPALQPPMGILRIIQMRKKSYYDGIIAEIDEFNLGLREDIFKSMEMYERLYGRPHPRKDEFAKM